MLDGVDVALCLVSEDFVADKGMGVDFKDQQMIAIPAIKFIGTEERLRHGMFGLAASGGFTERFHLAAVVFVMDGFLSSLFGNKLNGWLVIKGAEQLQDTACQDGFPPVTGELLVNLGNTLRDEADADITGKGQLFDDAVDFAIIDIFLLTDVIENIECFQKGEIKIG